MKINSDDIVFDAIITKAATENIDLLNDYGENDPFTETPEFEKMMENVYSSIKKTIKKESKKKKSPRFIAAVAAIMVLILATVSLNASAINVFLFKSYIDIRGEILQIETDEADMYQQYANISNYVLKDKIFIPGWLPKGTKLVGITDNKFSLALDYQYNGKEILFSQEIIPENIDSKEYKFFLERSDYEYIENYSGKKSVYFLKINGDTGNETYSAVWNDENALYKLKVGDSEIMLQSIIKYLKPYALDE